MRRHRARLRHRSPSALIFDVINGFHDAANSIATVVSTRVLSPRLAVLWATRLQLRRAVHLPRGRRQHDREDHRRSTASDPRVRVGRDLRPRRRDRVEPADVVVGPAVVELARADRRPVGRRASRTAGSRPQHRQALPDARVHPARAAARPGARRPHHVRRLLAVPPHAAAQGRPRVPRRPAVLGGRVLDRPRRQRRAEDDRRDLGRDDRGRHAAARRAHARAVLGRSSRRTARWRSAPRSAAGASSRRWAWASRASSRSAASARASPARSRCSARPSLHIPVSTTHTITGAIVGVGSVTKLRGIRWGLATRIV